MSLGTDRDAFVVGVGRLTPSVILLSILLVGWQAFTVVTGVPSVIVPSPVAVAGATVARGTVLLDAATVTALTASLGLVGGTVVGLSLAFAMTASRDAAAVLHPYVVALRIAPMIAIAPLLFLWLGHGIPARAALVVTLTVFPVAIASLDGLQSVPQEYLDLARSIDASKARTFLTIRVPAAAPSVFAGIKLAAALSVVGAVIAEFLILDSGLGYRVFDASRTLRTARMFAALFVLALLGIGFYLVPALIEKQIRWGRD